MNRLLQPIRNFRQVAKLSSENLGRMWPEQNSKNAELRICNYLEREKRRLQKTEKHLAQQKSELLKIEKDITGFYVRVDEQNSVDYANQAFFKKKEFHPEERHKCYTFGHLKRRF